MNLVSTFTFQMTVKGDSIRLSGAGYSDDADTRELLEDALRGILAAAADRGRGTSPRSSRPSGSSRSGATASP